MIQGNSNKDAPEPLSDRGIKYARLIGGQTAEDDPLWAELCDDVLTVCKRIPDFAGKADEIAQEAIIALWEKLPSLPEGSDVWLYLKGIIRHKALGQIKENKRARRHESLSETEGARPDLDAKLPATSSPAERQEERQHSQEYDEFESAVGLKLKRCVAQTMEKLPDSTRQLFAAYYARGNHDPQGRSELVELFEMKSYINLQTRVCRIWPRVLEGVKLCLEASGINVTELLSGQTGRSFLKNYIKEQLRLGVERSDRTVTRKATD